MSFQSQLLKYKGLNPLGLTVIPSGGVLDIKQSPMLFQNKGLNGSNKPLSIAKSPSVQVSIHHNSPSSNSKFKPKLKLN